MTQPTTTELLLKLRDLHVQIEQEPFKDHLVDDFINTFQALDYALTNQAPFPRQWEPEQYSSFSHLVSEEMKSAPYMDSVPSTRPNAATYLFIPYTKNPSENKG
jgi:hypothetical protein